LVHVRSQKGIALVTVLLFIVVLLIIGVAFSLMAVSSNSQAVRFVNQAQAYYIARAGAASLASYIVDNPASLSAEALSGFVDSIVAVGTSSVNSYGGGTYVIRATKNLANTTIELESTGTFNGITSTVTKTINIIESTSGGPILDMAVFATKARERRYTVDKKGNIVYSEPAEAIFLDGSAYVQGPVGTNSIALKTVTFDWSTKVFGDVNIGPSGNTNTSVFAPSDMGSYIINPGTRKVLPSLRQYPLPLFPTFPTLPSKGAYTAGWWPAPPYTLPLSGGDGWYSSLTVLSTLRIEVGSGTRRLRIDNLQVTGAGKIEIVGSGNLILYVSLVNIANSGAINNLGDPSKVHMYYNGATAVDFGGDTKYYGSIYIKDANLIIGNSGGIQGNIITGSNTVTVNGDASATVKTLYAPNAHVIMGGSGKIKGAVVANSFFIDGGAWVQYVPITNPIPDLPVAGPSTFAFEDGRWK
jgi:hypothetical protein